MAAFGKTARGVIVGALIIAPIFVTTNAAAYTVNFESLEVEESQGQAVMAIDIPPGGVVEPEQFANRNELVLTFHGVPTTSARRVHAGQDLALFKSVDVEPWYENGEQQTRMVVRYAPHSQVSYSREGDILVVTLFDSGEGSSAEWAATPDALVSSNPTTSTTTSVPVWSSDASVSDAAPVLPKADATADIAAAVVNQATETASTVVEPSVNGASEVARYEWDAPAADAYADNAYVADATEAATETASDAATMWTVDDLTDESTTTEPAAEERYVASGYTYDAETGTYAYVGSDDAAATRTDDTAWESDAVSVADAYAAGALPVADMASKTMTAAAAPSTDAAKTYSSERVEPANESPYAAEMAETSPVADASVTETTTAPRPTVSRDAVTPSSDGEDMTWRDSQETWDATARSWQDVNAQAWDASETLTSKRANETASTPVVAGLAQATVVSERANPADAQPVILTNQSRNIDDPPLISLDVQGADISTVLRSISESSGANIVANSDVKGKVTIKLVDLPWRRALGIVLRTQGMGHVDELGVIRVASEQKLRQEDIERQTAAKKREELTSLETAVVPVSFASAPELAEALSGRLTLRGALDVDARTNSLIVTDVPSNIPVLTDLVQLLDTRTPQVEIVAKLVDLDMSAVRDLGVNWFVGNIHSTTEGLSASGGVDAQIAGPVGSLNFGVLRDFADLDLTLQALETEQRANIISTPKITTVNNREARVLVGQEIPLITLDEAGNAITELKKIGIELKVTPYINQGDMITLDLHPMVSDLASQSTQQGGVIINTAEADTRVMVRNGETAVIGGLIRTNKTSFTRSVPVLGKIPILGALFRTTTDSDSKRELVIFVTPRTIR